MNWLTIKAKLVMAGAFLLAVAAGLLRMSVLKDQRDKAREKARVLDAQVKENRANEEAEAKIEVVYSDLEREAKKEIENDQMPDSLRNRNNR